MRAIDLQTLLNLVGALDDSEAGNPGGIGRRRTH